MRAHIVQPEVARSKFIASSSDSRATTSTFPAIKKLTPAEAREQQGKGLRYHCDKGYTPNPKCKTQKLFWVEGLLQEEPEDVEDTLPSKHTDAIADEVFPEISLHAISGTRAPQTKRVLGMLRQCQITILIDSGSTHNFIDPIIIWKAQIPTQSDFVFEVMVSNGDCLKGNGRCKWVLIQAQGVPIKVDFYLSCLGGCDAVLGAQWLRTLAPVVWDFSSLSMSFKDNDKEYFLNGIPTSDSLVVGPAQLAKDMRCS